MNNRTIRNFKVIHRIGGLEIALGSTEIRVRVIHRIGGLEILGLAKRLLTVVIHRIGGLEKGLHQSHPIAWVLYTA